MYFMAKYGHMESMLARIQAWIRGLPERLRKSYKKPEFWLTFAAYAIPLAFLLYVLYINYLPFGFSATYTIAVGAPGDTDASKPFYLEPSQSLSGRMTDASSTPYRTLNGLAYAVFNPGVVLKNATITASVTGGPGISIIPPTINFDPSSVKWDYSWDFASATPSDLTGNAFHFDDCEYFDGKSQLQLPDSSDKFESGPFTVYAEWTPQDSTDDFQEIVGHYNWELLQNHDSVSFQIGRMNNATGPFYSVDYPVTSSFFKQEHTAVAIYSPSLENGYIDLYVDEHWAGRSYFGNSNIWPEYNENKPLTFGKAAHGAANYLLGCVYKINFDNVNYSELNTASLKLSGNGGKFAIVTTATTSINSIKMSVNRN